MCYFAHGLLHAETLEQICESFLRRNKTFQHRQKRQERTQITPLLRANLCAAATGGIQID